MLRKTVVALVLVLLPGCGATDGGFGARPPDDDLYEATATVLESGEHGPMLCLGAIADSLPPQCGDVPITNWDWDRVKTEERVAGTIWGRYHVTGTFDGDSFTLTDVGPPQTDDSTDGDPIGTPCEEPSGGWEAPDPNRAGHAHVGDANAAVRRDREFAGLWIDYLNAPGEKGAEILLNVAFTDDLDSHEAELRAHWGGPLCLVQFDRSWRDLRRIQSEMSGRIAESLGLQVLFSSVDVEDNAVELGVVVIDDKRRKAIEERYGKGTVRIGVALKPAH